MLDLRPVSYKIKNEINNRSAFGFIAQEVKPVINELPIKPGCLVVAFTDGIQHAGQRSGSVTLNPLDVVHELIAADIYEAQKVVDTLLDRAMEMDQGRPQDDISVMAIAVLESENNDPVRRLSGRVSL